MVGPAFSEGVAGVWDAQSFDKVMMKDACVAAMED